MAATSDIAITTFSQVIKTYDSSINHLGLIGYAFAKETFSDFILIAVAVIFITHLIKKQVDAAEAHVEFFNNIFYLYFMFFLIYKSPQFPLLMNFFQTFKQAGMKFTSVPGVDNPGTVLNVGFQTVGALLDSAQLSTAFLHMGASLVAVGCAFIILFCFAFIAIELVCIDIGGRIILAAGVFMLGFSASPWTRTYSEKYISAIFQIGIKMMFLYILVGIGNNVANEWSVLILSATDSNRLEAYLAIAVSAFVYYKLCTKLPDMATSMLTGSFSTNFNHMPSPMSLAGGMMKGAMKNMDRAKKFSSSVGGFAGAAGQSFKAGQKQANAEGKGAGAALVNAVKTFGRATNQTKNRQNYAKSKDSFWGKTRDNIKEDAYYQQYKSRPAGGSGPSGNNSTGNQGSGNSSQGKQGQGASPQNGTNTGP